MLVCHPCAAPLALEDVEEREGDIVAGALRCTGGHRYPIVNAIPRFVDSQLYAGSFGFEWNRHQRTQRVRYGPLL